MREVKRGGHAVRGNKSREYTLGLGNPGTAAGVQCLNCRK